MCYKAVGRGNSLSYMFRVRVLSVLVVHVYSVAMKFITLLLSLVCFQVSALEIGSDTPNLFGRTLDGKLFRLSEKTGPVVINFFWVECKPCVKEMPELAHLGSKYPKIDVISVHVEDEERSTVQDFVNRLPAHPKTIVTASPAVKGAFDIRALPHTVIVNKGKVELVVEGYTEKSFSRIKRHMSTM